MEDSKDVVKSNLLLCIELFRLLLDNYQYKEKKRYQKLRDTAHHIFYANGELTEEKTEEIRVLFVEYATEGTLLRIIQNSTLHIKIVFGMVEADMYRLLRQ